MKPHCSEKFFCLFMTLLSGNQKGDVRDAAYRKFLLDVFCSEETYSLHNKECENTRTLVTRYLRKSSPILPLKLG